MADRELRPDLGTSAEGNKIGVSFGKTGNG